MKIRNHRLAVLLLTLTIAHAAATYAANINATEANATETNATEANTTETNATDTYAVEDIHAAFTSEPISEEIFARIDGKSYREECPVPLEDLRYLRMLYRDFEGETQEGEMIVNAAIAEDVLEIFEELYKAEYPIEQMTLVDDYEADDEISMTNNNTSAFNFRLIEGSTHVSKHGLGLAIDLNPLYNPYVKQTEEELIILPAAGEAYVDRTENMDHKITEDDLCYQLFMEHGFEWGGNWNSLKDYQHFEMPTDQVRELYDY